MSNTNNIKEEKTVKVSKEEYLNDLNTKMQSYMDTLIKQSEGLGDYETFDFNSFVSVANKAKRMRDKIKKQVAKPKTKKEAKVNTEAEVEA